MDDGLLGDDLRYIAKSAAGGQSMQNVQRDLLIKYDSMIRISVTPFPVCVPRYCKSQGKI